MRDWFDRMVDMWFGEMLVGWFSFANVNVDIFTISVFKIRLERVMMMHRFYGCE